MNNYFCPECGASLDPGEKCTCPGYVVKAMTAKEKAVAAATVTAKRMTGSHPKVEKGLKYAKKSITQSSDKIKQKKVEQHRLQVRYQ